MRNMTLENIAMCCGGTYHGPDEKRDKCVSGIAIDSRKIEKDWLFIATKGNKVDGHSFMEEVMDKGALCVVCEKEPENKDMTYILVEDSFRALRDIAAFYRRQLSCKVVGITGSVGKTSTKEMVAGVLSVKYNVLKTQGNFNNEVGLPLTVFRIREEHEVAVLEMGISDFGEMRRLTEIAKPDICIITNIGQCHLENLKTRDGVLKAKTEIFEGMPEDGRAVLNGGDDKLATIQEVNGSKPCFFDSSELYASDVVSKGLFGTSCRIHMGEETLTADIQVPGKHQISNALAAVGVAKLLGLTKEEMEKGIHQVEAIGGRNHMIEGTIYTIIDDCYNANPVSMKAAIDLLGEALDRKVAILGDMFELGENSDKLHENIGAYAATSATDVLICIGENARHIYEGAESALENGRNNEKENKNIYYFGTKDEFLKHKDFILKKGDTLLLKASHGMAFETLVEALTK